MGRRRQDTSVQIPYHLHPRPRREKEHNSRAGVLRTPGILPRKHHSTCTTFPKIGASHETRPLLSRPTSVAHGFEAIPVALSHGEPVYRAWISLCALRRSTHRPRSAVGQQSTFAIFAAQDEVQSPARPTDLRPLRTHGERTSGHLRTNPVSSPSQPAQGKGTQLPSRSPAHARHPSKETSQHMHDLFKDWSLARNPTSAFPSNVRGTRTRSDSRRAIPRRAGLSCLDFLVRTRRSTHRPRSAVGQQSPSQFLQRKTKCSRPLARQTCVLSARMGRGHQDTSVQIPYHLHPRGKRDATPQQESCARPASFQGNITAHARPFQRLEPRIKPDLCFPVQRPWHTDSKRFPSRYPTESQSIVPGFPCAHSVVLRTGLGVQSASNRPSQFLQRKARCSRPLARQTCVLSARMGRGRQDTSVQIPYHLHPSPRRERNTTPEQESCARPASFQGNITAHARPFQRLEPRIKPDLCFPVQRPWHTDSKRLPSCYPTESRSIVPGFPCAHSVVLRTGLGVQSASNRPSQFLQRKARCSRPLARQTCVLSARMGRGRQDTSVQIPYHLHPRPRREKGHNSRAGVLRTPGILPRKHHSTCTTFPKIGASHETRPLLSRPTSVAHGFEATPVALSHGEPVYRAWISLCALCRSTHRPRSAVGRQSPFAIFGALCFRSVECAPWKPRICLQAPATFEFRRKDDALV